MNCGNFTRVARSIQVGVVLLRLHEERLAKGDNTPLHLINAVAEADRIQWLVPGLTHVQAAALLFRLSQEECALKAKDAPRALANFVFAFKASRVALRVQRHREAVAYCISCDATAFNVKQ